MHTNRNTFDIYSAILNSAKNGQTKTRLTYGAFVSFRQLCNYLEDLERKQFIEYVPEHKLYRTTGNGVKFLEQYRKLLATIVEEEGEGGQRREQKKGGEDEEWIQGYGLGQNKKSSICFASEMEASMQ